jgi:flagellar basal body-associated protein FliL
MPEENAPEQQAAKPAKKSGGLIVGVVVLLIAAAGGFVTYKFAVAPMFSKAEEPPVEVESDAIPPTSVGVDFPETQAAVRQDDPNGINSVLMYSCSFICSDEECKLLVEKNKQWFVSKLDELHRNRTKTELNDPQVEKEITRLALEEANSLLRRLQEKPNPEIRVIEVLHLKFAVFDL